MDWEKLRIGDYKKERDITRTTNLMVQIVDMI